MDEEVVGKLILESATAIPVREIPKKTIRKWISEDEEATKAFKAKKRRIRSSTRAFCSLLLDPTPFRGAIFLNKVGQKFCRLAERCGGYEGVD